MMYFKQITPLAAILAVGLFFTSTVSADLSSLKVIALGAMDGRAVVISDDGKMHVLGVGDAVPGSQARVKQVLIDRLVVEEPLNTTPSQTETVWIYKSEGGKSRIQRLNQASSEQPVLIRDSLQ